MDQIHEETILAVAVIGLAGWMLWLFFRRYQMASQVRLKRADSFNQLIEKFGSAQEFLAFAQSEEGKRLLTDPIIPQPNPLMKVLRFIQAGILFCLIGVAYFINAGRWQFLPSAQDPNYFHKAEDFNSYGTISLLLGIGLLLIAGVTYLFVRRWHLANGNTPK